MNDNTFFFLYDLAHRSKFFDGLVYFTAEIFPYIILILAVAFLIFHHEVFDKKNPVEASKKKRREMYFVFLSVFLAWVLSVGFKLVLKVPRPFLQFENIQPFFSPSDYSFPSGHASLFSAIAIAIYLCHKRAGLFFILAALLIGIARIIAGVHFPLDVLVGFFLGTFISYFLIKFFRRL